MSIGDTCVVQVTNIAPNATNEQMKTLFSFLGTIKEIVVYPSEDSPIQSTSRVCYIRFADEWSVGVAQHLTNTVFVDRALIVLPINDGKIPDAATALSMTNGGSLSGGSNNGIVSQVVTGVGGAQVITTIDPRLTALGLPQYPPLPANMDPTKIEEIRRTVYVGNLDSTISAEQLLKFFNQIGEVKYVRMAGDETQPTRFAFIEFTDQSSVANALQYNGVIFGGRPLKINHSNNAIVKPQAKSSEAAQKEIEEAMKRVREAQSLISAAIEPGYLKFDKILEYAGKEKKSSRSRSRSRSRRSTSRSRRAVRSRSRTRRSRSRERRRSRSRSREKRRSRSPRRRSRSHGRRSHSRERRHRRRSRSREKERSSRRRSRSRDKLVKKKHSRSRSPSKSKKTEVKEKLKEVEKLKEKLASLTAPQLNSEIDTKPEGPELPPETVTVKSEPIEKNVTVSEIKKEKHTQSPERYKELSKSPRRSPSLSPVRKVYSRRSRSPKRRSRSRGRHSGSPVKSERHRKKRDRDRDRSRSKDKYTKEKKKKRRDKDDTSELVYKESKVKRDYDEEEKGYDSNYDERTHRSSYDKFRKMSISPEDD